jgi:ribosomal protein L11 methyltransferase
LNESLKNPTRSDTVPHWYQLSFEIPARALAAAEAALNALGAVSLSLKDAADQPLLEPAPGETPLWDTLIVEALFDAETPHAALIESLQHELPFLKTTPIKTSRLENRVWERVWMDRFKPMSFGSRLWIYPSHIKPASEDSVNIMLDPGLAFGTGTHATTALCLQWLDAQDMRGKTVIDYGCGSGVLAIAARKLGAKKVYAVDIDAQALQATHDNAERNQVRTHLEICSGDQLAGVQADIVMANIISGILITLHDTLTAATRSRGELVMSGILPNQIAEIRQAYSNEFEFKAEKQLENWCLLASQKRR